jgi:hypothetical protein
VFRLFGTVYKFVYRLVIYGDRQKDACSQWQWSKEISWLRYKATTRSHDTHEVPLIGSVVRMTVMVHRQLDLSKSFGVDSVFKVGLLSVEPTLTGRGVQDLFNCRLPAELYIATYSMVFVFESGKTLPGRSVVCLAATTPCPLRPYNLLGSLDKHCIYNIPQTAISTSSLLCNVQGSTETSVCLQIVLNINGTGVQ